MLCVCKSENNWVSQYNIGIEVRPDFEYKLNMLVFRAPKF